MSEFFLNKSKALFAVFVFFLFLGAIVFAQSPSPNIGSTPGYDLAGGRIISDLCENCWFKIPMQCRLDELHSPQTPLPTNSPFGVVSSNVTVDQGPFETLPPDYYFLHPHWIGQENVLLPPEELDDRRFVAQLYDKSLNLLSERQFDLPELSFIAFGDGINGPDPFCTQFGIVPYVYLPHNRLGQYIHIKSLEDHGLYNPSTPSVPNVNIEDYFNDIQHASPDSLPHDAHNTVCIGNMKKIRTPGNNFFYLTNNLEEAVNNCQAGWHASSYNRKYELVYVDNELYTPPPGECCVYPEIINGMIPSPPAGCPCYPFPTGAGFDSFCLNNSEEEEIGVCRACLLFDVSGNEMGVVPSCLNQAVENRQPVWHTLDSDTYETSCEVPACYGDQEPPPEYPPRTIFYYRILPENNCQPTELPTFTETWENNLNISGSPAPDIYVGDNTAVCVAVAGEYCRCKIAPLG